MTCNEEDTVLNGMKIIIVVHMMPYLQFCLTYGLQNQKKKWKKIPINIFPCCVMDSNNI